MGFDAVAAKAWRSTNYALLKVAETFDYLHSIAAETVEFCAALPSGTFSFVPKSVCVAISMAVKISVRILSYVAKLVRLNIHYQLILVACIKCIIHAHHYRSVCT